MTLEDSNNTGKAADTAAQETAAEQATPSQKKTIPETDKAPRLWRGIAGFLILVVCQIGLFHLWNYQLFRLWTFLFRGIEKPSDTVVNCIALAVGILIVVKMWNSAPLSAFARKLQDIVRRFTDTYNDGSRKSVLPSWTFVASLVVFGLTSYGVQNVMQSAGPLAFPWQDLPGYVGTAVGLVVAYELYTRRILDKLTTGVEKMFNGVADLAGEPRSNPGPDPADAFIYDSIMDAFSSSEPSSSGYTQSSSTTESSWTPNSSASDPTWENYKRSQNEYFHRKQAEQAEYGGYTKDAEYHRNRQQQYRG